MRRFGPLVAASVALLSTTCSSLVAEEYSHGPDSMPNDSLVFGTGAHNGKHGGAIFPDSIRWLWRGWKDEAP
jgi:hypothetical protein